MPLPLPPRHYTGAPALAGPQIPLDALRAAVGGGGYTATPVQTQQPLMPAPAPAAAPAGPMQYHPLMNQASHHAAALAAIAARLNGHR